MYGHECLLKDIEEDNLDCLDYFVEDVVATFINTTDLDASESDMMFHIPAFFGDDFAYTQAEDTFAYINGLGVMLERHSLERYGIQMSFKYSTIDEYLEKVKAKPYIKYPIY